MVHPRREAPPRSLVQRMDALQQANHVRSLRANLKKDLKGGKKSIDDIFLNPPYYVHTMKVFDLVLSAPKIGRVKANVVMKHCRISPSKTVDGLTTRQREEIISRMKRSSVT